MIIAEIINNDRVKHYSSDGKWIHQVGVDVLFRFAIDVCPCPYTYEEYDGDIPIDEPSVEDKAAAYDILIGEAE